LIIIGTSLAVYPFAGIVERVYPDVPRLLINNEPAGDFSLPNPERQTDVFHCSSSDEGCAKLAELLGWKVTTFFFFFFL